MAGDLGAVLLLQGRGNERGKKSHTARFSAAAAGAARSTFDPSPSREMRRKTWWGKEKKRNESCSFAVFGKRPLQES